MAYTAIMKMQRQPAQKFSRTGLTVDEAGNLRVPRKFSTGAAGTGMNHFGLPLAKVGECVVADNAFGGGFLRADTVGQVAAVDTAGGSVLVDMVGIGVVQCWHDDALVLTADQMVEFLETLPKGQLVRSWVQDWVSGLRPTAKVREMEF